MSADKYPSFLSSVQEASQSNVSSPPGSSIPPEKWENPMWAQIEPDAVRWNRLYPYRLAVVKASKNKDGKISYSEDLKWQFTLPIPPESLDVTTNFAIEMSATIDGVHAEHNGVVFKDVSISGSTGILPLRGAAPTKDFNPGNSIFGGTIAAGGRTVSSALGVANGGISPTPNFVVKNEEVISGTDIGKTSGYYQFHLLAQFLENYANFKKSRDGRDYRLVFSVYKDNHSYLVEPIRFRLARKANSAFKYPYELQMRSYGRVKLNNAVKPAEEFKPAVLNPNLMGQMLSTIQKARETIYNANDTIRAMGMDLDTFLFEPLRKMALFVKEAVGSPLTLMEIPATIISGAKDAIVSYVSVAAYGSQMINQAGKSAAFNQMIEDIQAVAELTGLATRGVAGKSFGGLNTSSGPRSKLAQSYGADPSDRIFRDPISSHQLMSAIQPANLNLPEATIRAINQERNDVKRLTRKDFEGFRDNFEKLLTNFEFSIGGGNDTIAALYGIKTANNPLVEPNDEHFEIIHALNRLIQESSKLASTREVNRLNISPVEYVAGLANRSGLAFKVPVSKFAVPFPYGYTLEDLSRQYLGAPDRWMEISQLNGLRTPYVDEEGFTKALLVDGFGNQVTVASADNLALGQSVWLVSNAAIKTKRKITGIDVLPTHTLLTLDGEADLENYEVGSGAYLHAFLPGTVNSQMSIYIPSSVQTDEEVYQTKDIPGLEDFDPIIAAGGVDLLLDQNNDLIVTPDGDTRLAIGLANIIQRVRVMLSVTRGTLNQHPDYGLPIEVGASLADLSATQIATAVKDMFDAVPGWAAKDVRVDLTAPTCAISLNLYVPGTSELIPVFFELSR